MQTDKLIPIYLAERKLVEFHMVSFVSEYTNIYNIQAIFGICAFACIFGTISTALNQSMPGIACRSWGSGVFGTFFGWLAGGTLLKAASADYPDFYMTIHFMLVRNYFALFGGV